MYLRPLEWRTQKSSKIMERLSRIAPPVTAGHILVLKLVCPTMTWWARQICSPPSKISCVGMTILTLRLLAAVMRCELCKLLLTLPRAMDLDYRFRAKIIVALSSMMAEMQDLCHI